MLKSILNDSFFLLPLFDLNSIYDLGVPILEKFEFFAESQSDRSLLSKKSKSKSELPLLGISLSAVVLDIMPLDASVLWEL